MADYAYLRLWSKEFTIERGLHHLEALLQLFPQSAARPGFRLIVRSLGPEESPTLERDLIATPADVRTVASEFLHEDTAYEVTAWWDLWQPRERQTRMSAPPTENNWEQAPAPVGFVLEGEEYDPGRDPEAREHLVVSFGPESLYLAAGRRRRAPAGRKRPPPPHLFARHSEVPAARAPLGVVGRP